MATGEGAWTQDVVEHIKSLTRGSASSFYETWIVQVSSNICLLYPPMGIVADFP